jgi:hypothetical protein
MKTIIRIFALVNFILLFAFLFEGCLDTSDASATSSVKNSYLGTYYMIMIDGTGSYKFVPKAKETVKNNFIAQLNSHDKILVRWLTENSVSDQCSICSAVIPSVPTSENPFDVNAKRQVAIGNNRIEALKKQLLTKIDSAESPRSSRTDIYGALFAASERFASNPDFKPVLVLLTDMRDNVKRNFRNIQLSGCDVQVLDYQVDPNEDGRKEFWTDTLKHIGAQNVRFAHIDDTFF